MAKPELRECIWCHKKFVVSDGRYHRDTCGRWCAQQPRWEHYVPCKSCGKSIPRRVRNETFERHARRKFCTECNERRTSPTLRRGKHRPRSTYYRERAKPRAGCFPDGWQLPLRACEYDAPAHAEDRNSVSMWDLVPDPGPSPDERVERQQQRERVWNALGDALPEREADMLRRRFGIGHYTEHSLDDIGELYGLSRERVRQLVLEGLAAVKEYLTPLRRAM